MRGLLATFVTFSVAKFVQAQSSTFALTTLQTVTSTASSASSTVATWTVRVGDGDHTFKPGVVQANVGDVIEFAFFPPNHSVVRAEYLYPCIPYEMTGRGKVGFFAGFHPVDAILAKPPTWTVRINDTNPIFYYCSAPGSCINYQMVGVINPNSSVSLQKQKDAAKEAKYMLNPGESFPPEGATSSMSSSSVSTPTSTSTSAPATLTTIISSTPSALPDNHGALSAGAIAGIAIGAAVVLILAAALFFFIGRTKTLKDQVRQNRQSTPTAGTMSPFQPISEPIFSGETVYVPVKSSDFHRVSQMSSMAVPPYDSATGPNLDPRTSPRSASPGDGHPRPLPVSLQSGISAEQPRTDNVARRPSRATPFEMFAPMPEHD